MPTHKASVGVVNLKFSPNIHAHTDTLADNIDGGRMQETSRQNISINKIRKKRNNKNNKKERNKFIFENGKNNHVTTINHRI
jgi:hypothetical protein